MKKDAHYYAVLANALFVGFKKSSAEEIAYASQFVDDATINTIELTGEIPKDIDCEEIDGKKYLVNMATCHSYFKIKTFNYNSMINNTVAFHFAPGGKGDSFEKRLRCIQDGPVIRRIIDRSMETDDLVKLGMCLHVYADTFSHQGFSGLMSKVNDIRDSTCDSKFNAKLSSLSGWSKFFKLFWVAIKNTKWFQNNTYTQKFLDKDFDMMMDMAMPAYGHGQAVDYSDLPFISNWSYSYDKSGSFINIYKSTGPIDNQKRFIEAFSNIQQILIKYLEKYPQHRSDEKFEVHEDDLNEALILFENDKGREENWKKLLRSKFGYTPSDKGLDYDHSLWCNDAFENFNAAKKRRKLDNMIVKNNFTDSKWYQYYLATKWYKNCFFDCCREEGIDISM